MFDPTTPKSRQLAIVLAFASMVVPVAGFHKFYLGQPIWGVIYVLLSWTPIPHIASAIEAVWYLTQASEHFDDNFNSLTPAVPVGLPQLIAHPMTTVAQSIRELEQLRIDGLISEYEFEQKRRQWLDQV
jgi:TM2 domain-containing membrane protein YozV